MTEHVHGCLSCRPDMVPDFDRADPRYHDGEKCPRYRWGAVLPDGAEPGFTKGVFEGAEGWVLYALGGPGDTDAMHQCPCKASVCVEPRFGVVTVEHLPPVMIDVNEVLDH